MLPDKKDLLGLLITLLLCCLSVDVHSNTLRGLPTEGEIQATEILFPDLRFENYREQFDYSAAFPIPIPLQKGPDEIFTPFMLEPAFGLDIERFRLAYYSKIMFYESKIAADLGYVFSSGESAPMVGLNLGLPIGLYTRGVFLSDSNRGEFGLDFLYQIPEYMEPYLIGKPVRAHPPLTFPTLFVEFPLTQRGPQSSAVLALPVNVFEVPTPLPFEVRAIAEPATKIESKDFRASGIIEASWRREWVSPYINAGYTHSFNKQSSICRRRSGYLEHVVWRTGNADKARSPAHGIDSAVST